MKTTVKKQKILLLLCTGVNLGFTRSPGQYFSIIKRFKKSWRFIEMDYLRKAVREFYKNRLVEYKENIDGSINVVISQKGRLLAMKYKIDEIIINKPKFWDKKWRLVVFDIPEKRRKTRDNFRNRLKILGFYEVQKSVFIHPYDCSKEISFIVEIYNIRRFVRLLEVTKITNEEELKIKFGLL